MNVIRNPIKMSRTPARICQHVPSIGADTEEILMEMGYSEDYIGYLREKNVL